MVANIMKKDVVEQRDQILHQNYQLSLSWNKSLILLYITTSYDMSIPHTLLIYPLPPNSKVGITYH